MKKLISIVAFLLVSVLLTHAADPFRTYFYDGIYYYFEIQNYRSNGNIQQRPVAYVTHGDDRFCKSIDTISSLDNEISLKRPKDHSSYFRPPIYLKDVYYKGEVVIPETVTFNDTVWTVTGICEWAFAYSPELTSVRLPRTLESISAGAFYSCPNLTELKLPSALKSIDCGIVYKSGVKELLLPDSIMILHPGYTWGCDVYFSENQTVYDDVYAPIFDAIHNVNYMYDIRSDIPPHYKERGVFVFPKGRFLLKDWSVYADIPTLVVPDVERFGAVEGSIVNTAKLKYFVSMSIVPPVIDEYGVWYHMAGLWFEDSEVDGRQKWMDNYGPDLRKGLLDNYEGVTLVVPAGSEEAYRNAPVWENFQKIKGVDSFDEYLDPTAAAEVTAADAPDAPVEYFNIQGMRIDARNLTPGLYIRRQGNDVQKVYISK